MRALREYTLVTRLVECSRWLITAAAVLVSLSPCPVASRSLELFGSAPLQFTPLDSTFVCRTGLALPVHFASNLLSEDQTRVFVDCPRACS